MFDRRAVVKSLLALGVGHRAAALPALAAEPIVPSAGRPEPGVSAVVRETVAIVVVPGTGGAPGHRATLRFTEDAEGAWSVEANPTAGGRGALLHLPPGRTAGDALAGLLHLVRGNPTPRAEPEAALALPTLASPDATVGSPDRPAIVIGPVVDGMALVCLRWGDGEGADQEELVQTAPVKAARVNGVWTLIPLGEMRGALEAGLGA